MMNFVSVLCFATYETNHDTPFVCSFSPASSIYEGSLGAHLCVVVHFVRGHFFIPQVCSLQVMNRVVLHRFLFLVRRLLQSMKQATIHFCF